MDFEFDPAKDEANVVKHGISLSKAADLDFEKALIALDRRRDYGEARFQALGPIGGRIHLLAFTMRANILRAISLRKANLRERKRYETSI